MPGTPLIILSHSAINLEKPSEKTMNTITENKLNKISTNKELDLIKKLKDKITKEQNASKTIYKRRKAKGPNPLSCKKPKNKNKAKTK